MRAPIKTTGDIGMWLGYWNAAGLVNVAAIKSQEDVATARKFCAVMRTGVFCPDLVSTKEIWDAINV